MGYYNRKIRYNKYNYYCEQCNKVHLFTKIYGYGFMTMDGGDSIEGEYCLQCIIKDAIYSKFNKIRKKIINRIALFKILSESKKPLLKKIKSYNRLKNIEL